MSFYNFPEQPECAREEFNGFLFNLSSKGLVDAKTELFPAIWDKYPRAILQASPAKDLPILEEGQEWVCECGCGSSSMQTIPDCVYSEVGKEGLIEGIFEMINVSTCVSNAFDIPQAAPRYYGMAVWDNNKEDWTTISLPGN